MGTAAMTPVMAGGFGGGNLNPTGMNGTGGQTSPWGEPASAFGGNPGPIGQPVGPAPYQPFGGAPGPIGQPVGGPAPYQGGFGGYGTQSGGSPVSSPTAPFAPPTGSPGNYGYGSSANPNPMATSAVSQNPIGSTGSAGNTGGNLNSIFGPGVGGDISSFLSSNGGYNSALTQQAVQAQQQQMQLQANQNFGNVESGFGNAGISPNSSAAALGSSNFWSQTAAAENAMTAQEYMSMWQSSMSNETGLLESIAGPAEQYQQSQPNAFDWMGLGLQGAESGAMMGLMAAGVIAL